MSYETVLLIFVLSGLTGAGFLLAHFSEIAWHLHRVGKPGEIITDAAIVGWSLWMVYLGLLALGLLAHWPENTRPAIIVIGIAVAVTPWWILYRWLKWRHGKEKN
jgi:hypothetical protein